MLSDSSRCSVITRAAFFRPSLSFLGFLGGEGFLADYFLDPVDFYGESFGAARLGEPLSNSIFGLCSIGVCLAEFYSMVVTESKLFIIF